MPLTIRAILRSTSKPLCERTTTSSAPLARTSSTCFCMSSSRMPNVHFGIIQRGLAIGVKGNAWPITAIFTPPRSNIL